MFCLEEAQMDCETFLGYCNLGAPSGPHKSNTSAIPIQFRSLRRPLQVEQAICNHNQLVFKAPWWLTWTHKLLCWYPWMHCRRHWLFHLRGIAMRNWASCLTSWICSQPLVPVLAEHIGSNFPGTREWNKSTFRVHLQCGAASSGVKQNYYGKRKQFPFLKLL